MSLIKAIQVLKSQGIVPKRYSKIDEGYFFIANVKENTLQNSLYIVTNDGLIKSGTDYYIDHQGVETIEI